MAAEDQQQEQESDPEEVAAYGSAEFWDAEHRRALAQAHSGGSSGKSKSIKTEWYGEFEDVFDVLSLYMDASQSSEPVLQVGCGLSRLAEGLWRNGWTNVMSVDSSPAAIEHAQARDVHLQGLQYLCVDCADLHEFPSDSFGFVVGKGFLDSVFSSLGGARKVGRTLEEISRVLKPGGYFISISCAPPACRLMHLQRPDQFNWSVDTVRVSHGAGYYAFACQKFLPGGDGAKMAEASKRRYVPPPARRD